MPYPKKARRLPSVLTQQEVAQRIDAASSSFHRMLLLTLYATGVRRAELIRLPLRDIDSRRMVVHVRGGKGRQDRDVMLSEELLRALRQHWRARRPSGCSPPAPCRADSKRIDSALPQKASFKSSYRKRPPRCGAATSVPPAPAI